MIMLKNIYYIFLIWREKKSIESLRKKINRMKKENAVLRAEIDNQLKG
jgi:cell division protein FtsB